MPTLEEAVRTIYPAQKRNIESQDFLEGPRAFSEKRKPNWQNKQGAPQPAALSPAFPPPLAGEGQGGADAAAHPTHQCERAPYSLHTLPSCEAMKYRMCLAHACGASTQIM